MGEAPARFGLARVPAPGFAGALGRHRRALVADHFAGAAGAGGGIAVQADGAQRHAARFRFGLFGQVAVALAADALEQRWRWRQCRRIGGGCLAHQVGAVEDARLRPDMGGDEPASAGALRGTRGTRVHGRVRGDGHGRPGTGCRSQALRRWWRRRSRHPRCRFRAGRDFRHRLLALGRARRAGPALDGEVAGGVGAAVQRHRLGARVAGRGAGQGGQPAAGQERGADRQGHQDRQSLAMRSSISACSRSSSARPLGVAAW